jgi:hypothetical protein
MHSVPESITTQSDGANTPFIAGPPSIYRTDRGETE